MSDLGLTVTTHIESMRLERLAALGKVSLGAFGACAGFIHNAMCSFRDIPDGHASAHTAMLLSPYNKTWGKRPTGEFD